MGKGRAFLGDFLDVVEIRTKVVGLSSFAIGSSLALRGSGKLDWGLAALMLAATLCVDMGTTAWNSYGDWWRGTDDGRFNREADKVLIHGGRSPGFALFAALGLYAAALGLGAWIAALRGPEVLALGAAGLAAGFLYSAGPKPISASPFGEIFAGGFLGTVLVALSHFVQTGAWSEAVLLRSIPQAIMIASILTVNNACDIEGDGAVGRRTLSILIGRKASAILIPALGLSAYALAALLAPPFQAPALNGELGRFAALRFLGPALLGAGALASAPFYAAMLKRGLGHGTKGASMKSISLIFIIFTLASLAGILFG